MKTSRWLLPRGLRQEVDEMTWDAFLDEYAPTTGPLRLGQWTCTDTQRPAGRLGPQARNFQATLAHTEWAMGWSQDATQSALRAVVACANRLLAA